MLIKNIKNVWKNEPTFRGRISSTWWEIKKAHQRFWRGYDSSLVWGMNANLLNLIEELLIDLRDSHVGYPYIKGDIESDEDYIERLNQMIRHIRLVEHYDYMYEDGWTIEDIKECDKKRQFHQDEFFKMFAKYYNTLWD